ncbi:MAG: tRNA uridine-5-carboxymethylaminomethyl(34) synthesis GTPase MnmE, partial [Bacteroidota bacterium]|nr:tRNA uridine-5-carboxymethylaminomethyl(34) synthesis GTPase MnmE [Bacteroidota bacterium]
IREHSQDIIENMGVIKSKEKIKQADIVLYLYDINNVSPNELLLIVSEIRKQNANVISVANKIDASDEKFPHKQRSLPDSIFISAKMQTGIEDLKNKLFSLAAGDQLGTENVIVTNARHYNALKDVQAALRDIRKGIDDKISGDLLSLDIKRCLHYLGEITGQITNEDMLDYIFSKFCIGK